MSHLLQIDMAWPRCALAITTWPGSDMTYFITVGCPGGSQDRKSTRLNSSHSQISYAVFCLKKKNKSLYHLMSINDYFSSLNPLHQAHIAPVAVVALYMPSHHYSNIKECETDWTRYRSCTRE